jgi:hypothetical protein
VVGWESSDLSILTINTFLELCVLDAVRKSSKLNPHGESESSISVPVEGR